MAEIMKLREFVNRFEGALSEEEMEMIVNMNPGEHKLIKKVGFEIVFIRVTKFHMAKMYLDDFNGEE